MLTPLDQALRRIVAELQVCGETRQVLLEDAPGCVLRMPLVSRVDVPSADCSAMDGYAVATAELGKIPGVLPVSQRIAAGYCGGVLQAGTAARIFTGAPLPSGADAVVLQENTRSVAGGIELLQIPVAGDHVRCAGEDVRQGSILFAAGHRVRVQDIGVMAATGHRQIEVCRPLKVALITTGDELVEPGQTLSPGQIYNSNRDAIVVLLRRLGMEVVDLGTVPDRREITEQTLASAAELADCIVSCGGVSAGEEDHVRAAVEALGRLELWKLAMKPGKPFAFGNVAGKPFFGLPGNPVSAFVTFVLLVRPALLAISGCPVAAPKGYRIASGFSVVTGERQEFLRVQKTEGDSGSQRLIPYNTQSSGVSASLSAADGLAVIPAFTVIEPGDLLHFLSFPELVD